MDKENKKERQNEKRQYVKTLKELVEFCKRRDPRWKDYLESIRKEEEKKKEEIKLKKEEDTKRKQDTKIRARKEEEERWAELDAAKELENNEKTNIL